MRTAQWRVACFWNVFFVQILFLQVSCVVNLGAQSFSCYGKIFISTSVTSVGWFFTKEGFTQQFWCQIHLEHANKLPGTQRAACTSFWIHATTAKKACHGFYKRETKAALCLAGASWRRETKAVTYTKARPLYIDPKARLYRCKGAPLVVRNQVERRM